MKALRIAAVGAALAFSASIATAQPPAQGVRARPNAALFQGIALSDAQKTQVAALREKYGQERRALLGQKRARSEARQRPDSATRAKVRELTQREMADTRALLTADQRSTFDRNVAAVRKHAGERRHQRRA